MQQGGNKAKAPQEYTPKPVTAAEAKQSDLYMQMLIFKCEADWAYAMSMKKAISTQEGQKQEEAKAGLKNQSLFNQQDKNSGRNVYRLKAHARKRFQAAFKSCTQLAGVIEEVLDSFSKYETQAYLEGMQASYLMEVEKWQDALDYLMRAKVIYQKVA